MSNLTPTTVKVASAAFQGALKLLSDLPNGDSLVGYAQAGNIEPTVLVDDELRGSDLLPDALQMAQSIYIAYFLRAFSLHNISVGNANVSQRLDKFSTRRNPMASAIGSLVRGGNAYTASMEDYADRLPVEGDTRALPPEIQEIHEEAMANAALESNEQQVKVKGQRPAGKDTPESTVDNRSPGKKLSDDIKTGLALGAGGSSFSKSIDINEAVPLSTGRLVNVTIKEDKHEVSMPLQVRLNAQYINSNALVQIVGAGTEDITLGARFKKWRLGGIDFWRDLVFCQDLIDAHKGNLKADKTGIYLQLMQKRRQNSLSAALSGSMSANSSSNIIVMSKTTADALEMKIYGKLKDFNTRQKLFQQGYSMLMFIIDKQWGTVRMYTRDIPEYTELSDRDIRSANKNGGVDIGDVLNAYRAGSSPRL